MGGEVLGGLILLPICLIGLALSVGLPLAALFDMCRKYTLPIFLLSSFTSWLSAGGFKHDQYGNSTFPPMFFVFFSLWSLVFLTGLWVYYKLRRVRT